MPRVYIVYESHTGNTGRMAKAVAEGACEVQGVEVSLHRAAYAKAEDLAGADSSIIGAPTRNTKVPPEMSEFLKRMKQVPLRARLVPSSGPTAGAGKR